MSSSVTSAPAPQQHRKTVRQIARWMIVVILSVWLGGFVVIRIAGYRMRQ